MKFLSVCPFLSFALSAKQTNKHFPQHKVLNRLQTVFVCQMDNPGFQPTNHDDLK